MLFVITIWVLCKKGGPLNQIKRLKGVPTVKNIGAIEQGSGNNLG